MKEWSCMKRTWRAVILLAVVSATMASLCDDEDNRVTGSYRFDVVETRDTCDNELNGYSIEATISQAESGFTIQIQGDGTLTGDFDDAGVLAASGTIADLGEGRTTFMQIGIVIKQSEITDGTGRITFNGTFPGEPGQCIQELFITGDRIGGDIAPVLS
jgi:hypothetical protein